MNTNVNNFRALVAREFWENKGMTLWLPLVICALLVLQNLLGLGVLFGNGKIDRVVEIIDNSAAMSVLSDDERAVQLSMDQWQHTNNDGQDFFLRLSDAQFAMSSGLHIIGGVFMAIAALVCGFYLLNCLYQDRNDRSVLFWKSLPVSETSNVLSKLVYGVLFIPLVVLVFAVIAEVSGSITLAMIYSASDNYTFWGMMGEINPVLVIWRQLLSIFVFAFNGLPIAGWLLFCSAFSRRLPFVMALLMPFIVSALEHFLLGQHYIGAFFKYVFSTGEWVLEAIWVGEPLNQLLAYYQPMQVITSLAFAAVLIAGAIWCRNNRFEI